MVRQREIGRGGLNSPNKRIDREKDRETKRKASEQNRHIR